MSQKIHLVLLNRQMDAACEFLLQEELTCKSALRTPASVKSACAAHNFATVALFCVWISKLTVLSAIDLTLTAPAVKTADNLTLKK